MEMGLVSFGVQLFTPLLGTFRNGLARLSVAGAFLLDRLKITNIIKPFPFI